jgi:DNA polymerase I-like protein with 3'-5' exonuclease and polymerase domains
MRTSFVRGYGSGAARIDLWYGILAENNTQAIAASALRRALQAVDDVCVLHTHDEIVLEVGEADLDQAIATLRHAMTDMPECFDGLPLTVSVEHGPYYTK